MIWVDVMVCFSLCIVVWFIRAWRLSDSVQTIRGRLEPFTASEKLERVMTRSYMPIQSECRIEYSTFSMYEVLAAAYAIMTER